MRRGKGEEIRIKFLKRTFEKRKKKAWVGFVNHKKERKEKERKKDKKRNRDVRCHSQRFRGTVDLYLVS